MIEKTSIQVENNEMSKFRVLMEKVSLLPKDKREQISMYVQGFLTRDAMERNKVS